MATRLAANHTVVNVGSPNFRPASPWAGDSHHTLSQSLPQPPVNARDAVSPLAPTSTLRQAEMTPPRQPRAGDGVGQPRSQPRCRVWAIPPTVLKVLDFWTDLFVAWSMYVAGDELWALFSLVFIIFGVFAAFAAVGKGSWIRFVGCLFGFSSVLAFKDDYQSGKTSAVHSTTPDPDSPGSHAPVRGSNARVFSAYVAIAASGPMAVIQSLLVFHTRLVLKDRTVDRTRILEGASLGLSILSTGHGIAKLYSEGAHDACANFAYTAFAVFELVLRIGRVVVFHLTFGVVLAAPLLFEFLIWRLYLLEFKKQLSKLSGLQRSIVSILPLALFLPLYPSQRVRQAVDGTGTDLELVIPFNPAALLRNWLIEHWLLTPLMVGVPLIIAPFSFVHFRLACEWDEAMEAGSQCFPYRYLGIIAVAWLLSQVALASAMYFHSRTHEGHKGRVRRHEDLRRALRSLLLHWCEHFDGVEGIREGIVRDLVKRKLQPQQFMMEEGVLLKKVTRHVQEMSHITADGHVMRWIAADDMVVVLMNNRGPTLSGLRITEDMVARLRTATMHHVFAKLGRAMDTKYSEQLGDAAQALPPVVEDLAAILPDSLTGKQKEDLEARSKVDGGYDVRLACNAFSESVCGEAKGDNDAPLAASGVLETKAEPLP